MHFIRFSPKSIATACAAACFSMVLVACGSLPGNERLRAPNYASPVSADRWEVSCGRNRIIIDDDSMDEFYNSDGSTKSYMDFCRDNEASLIRRRARDIGNQ
ncbi:MAG: hypothetical protein WDZ30_08115 [Cellvibrionaceae bacterium]